MTIYRVQVSFTDDTLVTGEFEAKDVKSAIRKALNKYRSVRGGEYRGAIIIATLTI